LREVQALTARARKFLGTAEQTLGIGDYDSCASRCYCAMFFMAEAARLTKKLSSSSHKGVLRLFGEHFVKTGILANHLGRALNHAHTKRIVGDYGMGLSVAQDEAQDLLETARDFVQRLEDYLGEWTDEG